MRRAMRWAAVICSVGIVHAASAQDDAAAALADCKAHQARLEELETSVPSTPPSYGAGGQQAPELFGNRDVEHERSVMEQSCAYAQSLLPKRSTKPAAPAPAPFRSDEPAPAPSPPVFDERPRVKAAPPPPPPPRPIVRRPPPPPPAPPSVGGTKARHPADESPQSSTPQ